jgi:menaquinone-specific isochorismate synthase
MAAGEAGRRGAADAARQVPRIAQGAGVRHPGNAHVELAGVSARNDEADERAPGRLTVRSVPVDDPGDLIARLPDPGAVAWTRGGEGLVGWGTAARVTLPAGEDRFTAGEKWLRELFDGAQVTDEVRLPGSGPVAFGSFTFDPASDGSVLVVPQTVLGRAGGRAWLTTIEGGRPAPGMLPPVPPAGVLWSDGSLTAPRWQQAVATAVTRIRAGELDKVVLARDLYANAWQDLDPRVLLARLAARDPDCYAFSCAGLVGATPELLIQREGRQVRSLVLAGTTRRGGTAAEDSALGAELLASAKNVEEHEYAAADVRAVLRPLCDRLEVQARPSLVRYASLQHLATRVTGTLRAPGDAAGPLPSALALAGALHPTAAICGTPQAAAMEMIRELEGMDRGRYTGPVGWVDARGNGCWGIAIRCAELTGSRARLFAGCGIVAESDPAAELAEAQTKFRPMQDALEG